MNHARPTPNYKRRVLADFGPRQREFLLRAFTQGVDLDDPLATPARTGKLEMTGLIHKRTSKKGRTSWRVTDIGRGIVTGHVPTLLAARSEYGYVHKPWLAMKGEPECINRAA